MLYYSTHQSSCTIILLCISLFIMFMVVVLVPTVVVSDSYDDHHPQKMKQFLLQYDMQIQYESYCTVLI